MEINILHPVISTEGSLIHLNFVVAQLTPYNLTAIREFEQTFLLRATFCMVRTLHPESQFGAPLCLLTA